MAMRVNASPFLKITIGGETVLFGRVHVRDLAEVPDTGCGFKKLIELLRQAGYSPCLYSDILPILLAQSTDNEERQADSFLVACSCVYDERGFEREFVISRAADECLYILTAFDHHPADTGMPVSRDCSVVFRLSAPSDG